MKKTVFILCLSNAFVSPLVMAEVNNSEVTEDTETQSNFRIGPRVASPESPAPVEGEKIFSKQGQWLFDNGISPHIGLTQLGLTNPGVGVDTNRSEALTMISAGADFDLDKMIGLNGGFIHFEELFVPWTYNLNYGNQVASVIAGKPAPFIPKKSHLTLFTYEQKLLDDKLSIEAGKSNAGNYIATPICNSGFSCVNSILQDSAGINPSPYANWSARIAYDVNPQLRVQGGWWKSNNAFPFTDGWERSAGKSTKYGGSLSNIYLADVAYKTTFKTEKYPVTLEAMGFYNDREQVNPLTAETSNAAKGFYIAGKKVFWRADKGMEDSPNPKALAVYGAFTHNMEKNATNGVASQLNSGIILNHPFQSRPFDSYGLNFIWAQLTNSEQRYLKQSYNGGDNYKPGRNESAITLDANFILNDSIVFSPFIMRTFNSNSWLSPTTSTQPKSGLALGAAFHIQLDTLLGLNPRPHP